MVFRPHYRLSLIGDLHGGAERFSFGLSLANNGGAGDTSQGLQPNAAQWDDVAADCVAFFGAEGNRIGNWARLTEVKVASIGADGKYTADPYIQTVNVVGGGPTSAVYPPQVALAVSLNTDRRGPSGKGRFYLPAFSGGVETATGLILQADRDTVRAAVTTLINNLNNEPGLDAVDLKVCVASTKNFNTPVTSVRVGRALDTIRSRRRSLPETYGADAAIA